MHILLALAPAPKTSQYSRSAAVPAMPRRQRTSVMQINCTCPNNLQHYNINLLINILLLHNGHLPAPQTDRTNPGLLELDVMAAWRSADIIYNMYLPLAPYIPGRILFGALTTFHPQHTALAIASYQLLCQQQPRNDADY